MAATIREEDILKMRERRRRELDMYGDGKRIVNIEGMDVGEAFDFVMFAGELKSNGLTDGGRQRLQVFKFFEMTARDKHWQRFDPKDAKNLLADAMGKSVQNMQRLIIEIMGMAREIEGQIGFMKVIEKESVKGKLRATSKEEANAVPLDSASSESTSE